MYNMYFEKITKLLAQAWPKFAITYRLEFKNCFGAVAGYVQGKIFISCGRFGVALKLPPETLETIFQEKGVKHLKYFPKGHVKKEYALLPIRILSNKSQFGKLLEKSIAYVQSSTDEPAQTPPKKKIK